MDDTNLDMLFVFEVESCHNVSTARIDGLDICFGKICTVSVQNASTLARRQRIEVGEVALVKVGDVIVWEELQRRLLKARSVF